MPQKFWERLIPMLFLILSALLFLPVFGINPSFFPAMSIHCLSFLTLGLLFEVPELSLNLYFLTNTRRKGLTDDTIILYRRLMLIRYLLTHFIGPCSGVMVVTSGLYLVHLGGYSLTEGWLFWILAAAVIGLYKGINHHNQYVQKLRMLLGPMPAR